MNLTSALALVGSALVVGACTAGDPTGSSDIPSSNAVNALPAVSDCGRPPAQTGAVQLTSLPLSQATTLKSENSDNATNIRFTNGTCGTIGLYWLDFGGNRVHYGDIPPGQTHVQNTFLTHPWVVTSDGVDLALYLPAADAANAQEAYIARKCSVKQRPLPPKITNGCGGTRG